MAKNKDYFKKLYRLVRILNQLERNGSVNAAELAEEFNISKRTAQRDIELLNMAEFPLVSETKGEYRFVPGFSLRNLPVTNEEASLLAFMCSMTKEMGGNFNESFKSIYAKVVAHTDTTSPYYAIMSKSSDGCKEFPMMPDVESAIEESRKLMVDYIKDGKIKKLKICPLKIIYHDGFWYLYALVSGTKWDIKLRFDKIKELEPINEKFTCPKSIQKTLDESVNIWLGSDRKSKIQIKVNADCAELFQKKKFFPHQKLVKTNKDGSIVLQATVYQHMEAIPTILRWIPNLTVVSPKELKEEIRDRVRTYLKEGC